MFANDICDAEEPKEQELKTESNTIESKKPIKQSDSIFQHPSTLKWKNSYQSLAHHQDFLQDEEENPWSVKNLDEFLYFCCPECHVKDSSQEKFIKHALEHHPKAKHYLEPFIIKEEFYENDEDKAKNYKFGEINETSNEELTNYSEPEIQIKQETKEKIIISKENTDTDSIEENVEMNQTINNSNFVKTKVELKCNLCEEDNFTSRLSLKKHKKDVHNEVKKFNCEQCGKFVANAKVLKDHIQTVHEGRKDHKCQYCNKDFGLKKNLDIHVQAIHEGAQHICENCGKAFPRKYDLKKHIKTVHLGQKNYKCEFCGKSYGHSSVLVNHIRGVHEKKQNYICDICGGKFNRPPDLYKHVKSVHEKIKPYKCDSCGKEYGKIAYLRNHKSTAH